MKSKEVYNFVNKFIEEDGGKIVKNIAEPSSEWRYLVEYPKNSGSMFEIFRPKNKSFTIVAAGLGLSDECKKAINSTGELKKEAIDSMSITLWFTEVVFSFYPSPEKFDKIDFAVRIYDESLSRENLFRALIRLEACRRFAHHHLTSFIRMSASSSPMFL
jgi:hypothetical protein